MAYIARFNRRERAFWFVLAAAMLVCGAYCFDRPVGLPLLAVGMMVLGTSLIGVCPGCALAGVRLRIRAWRRART